MDVRAGFLAKYSRWSHDRPCLVFTSVFMAIIAISAVVALANLAEFNTDAGDKVRRLLSRCPKKRRGGRNNLPTRLRPFTVRHSALFPPTPRFRFRFRFRLRRVAHPRSARHLVAHGRTRTRTFQEWIILDDPVTETADAAETALNIAARTADASGAGAALERSKQSEGGTLVFHFESDSGGSVFNPASLALMRDIDELVMSVPGYEDYCQLKYDPVTEEVLGCATRVSPTSYFFPTKHNNATINDGRGDLVDDVDAVVRMFSEDRRAFGYFLDGDFDAAGGVNRVTRVKYPMGAPRAGYVAADDREDDQRAEIGEGWLDAVEARLFKRFAMRARFLSTPYMGLLNENGTDVRFYAGYLRSKDSQRIIGYDLSWAGASILAVWVYMAAHTGSPFVATLGMFEILASFPVSIFLYRVFFRVSYLGNIQILSVFVVLGVGADDVFVFFDAFKQSAYEPAAVSGTTLTRVTYAARRASKAIFVTSLTTAVAFAATAMSDVMPIAAFGALSAIMIFVLFALNVLFFPPALVIYDRWVRNAEARRAKDGREGCRARVYAFFFSGGGETNGGFREKTNRNETLHVNEASMSSFDSESSDGIVAVDVQVTSDVESRFQSPTKLAGETETRGVDVAKLRRVERFYREPFFALVAHPIGKFLFVAGFAALLVFGVVMASQLETPAEQEAWYPDTHLMQSFSNNRRRFMSSDEDRVVPVDVYWGLGGMDVRGVDRYDPKQRGSLVLDSGFDASSAEAQAFLVSACDWLKNATCDAPGCGGPGSHLVRNGADAEVVCPMAAFRAYVETTLGETFPVFSETFSETLRAFVTSSHGSVYSNHIGFDTNGNLVFVRISTESTLVFPTTAKVSRPVFDVWQTWVFRLNARAPAGVANAKQTAYYTWTWMKTQEALVQNTFQGLIICFCMAFVVLLLSTMDLRAGLIATVTIAGVVTTVMGVGVRGIMGWDLGIGESIAAVILIGLSVDYCVHLANAYCEAPASLNTRELRVQHALMTMGISITASAVTTVVSGSMLWLCILTFFSKFAFLITATIVSSFAWSMFFLPSALAAFGPPGRYSWSSLKPAQDWLVRKWEERREK